MYFRMNELSVIGSLCLRKDFLDRLGANIPIRLTEKCMAKGCFDVQKLDFGSVFSRSAGYLRLKRQLLLLDKTTENDFLFIFVRQV